MNPKLKVNDVCYVTKDDSMFYKQAVVLVEYFKKNRLWKVQSIMDESRTAFIAEEFLTFNQ